jgi:hypothetical protein
LHELDGALLLLPDGLVVLLGPAGERDGGRRRRGAVTAAAGGGELAGVREALAELAALEITTMSL